MIMRLILIIYSILFIIQTSCSSISRKSPSPQDAHVSDEQKPSPIELENRIHALESKVTLLQEKIDDDQKNITSKKLTHSPKIQNYTDPSSTNERGKTFFPHFSEEQTTTEYKEAKILFNSERFHEAQLSFTRFIKAHPEHPLAPSAQFFLGLCSFELKEWQMARENLEKILTLYPYSAHISDTLHILSKIENNLNNPNQAQVYEQTLLSLFPQSPAAHLELDQKIPAQGNENS